MKTNAKVYVMVDGEGRIKLGHSVNPAARSKQMPRPVTLVHETDVIEQAERVERLAHRILALHGTHLRGEWFEASIDDALHAIELAVKQAENEELALGGMLDGRADIETSVSKYPQLQKLFSMRTDNEQGAEFLAALDRLRLAQRPVLDRTAMVMKLVFEADTKATKKERR